MTGNKTVLATGCSSGFGYEAAKLLARRGFRVFATMRKPEQGRELEAAASGFPGELTVKEIDATNKEQIRQVVDEAASVEGRFALPTLSPHAASKHAVEGMSESLSHELLPLGIRLVLLPATMRLFGRANWWMPKWLDRLIPDISVEGK